MIRWVRPRTLIALSAGVAAALIVWMMPPLSEWSMTVPEGSLLDGVSSDGRYVITYVEGHGRGRFVPETLSVWDRERGADKPILTAPMRWTLLSPDENTLAVIAGNPDEPFDVFLFDLATRQKVKSWQLGAAERFLFSADGDLLYVEGGFVRRVGGDQKLHPLPEGVYGFHGDFAIFGKTGQPYGQESELRLFSLRTGKETAHLKLPGTWERTSALSADGRVIATHGYAPGRGLWTMSDFDVLCDTADETIVISGRHHIGAIRGLSPGGHYVVANQLTRRDPWVAKFWPLKDGDTTTRITHWRTGAEIAQFRNVAHVEFSPQGNTIAIMRADGVIEGYAFPLRTPWGLIASSALVCALGVWGLGWLWTCWRKRNTGTNSKVS